MYYAMVKLSALCVFENMVCMGAVSACVCVPHARSDHRGQRRESDFWNLELQMVVTYHIWVLEIEHQSFGNIISALSGWAVSLAPWIFLNR